MNLSRYCIGTTPTKTPTGWLYADSFSRLSTIFDAIVLNSMYGTGRNEAGMGPLARKGLGSSYWYRRSTCPPNNGRGTTETAQPPPLLRQPTPKPKNRGRNI